MLADAGTIFLFLWCRDTSRLFFRLNPGLMILYPQTFCLGQDRSVASLDEDIQTQGIASLQN